ncbi:CDP-glucose 4,6-dehydratase [Termitidicoccus mucosus]|uniref:CDP-glucose 4,6-dehydratase n=1 Tax=Termitidicoccus mucosus TaxID=1184151 RepID=A0A178II18_9BACT|nr:CDP-glucose 4,6-dehydratase [Opitutaceae bacterium TSB47]
MSFANTYRGKRVLLTGHTGFKGSWLAEWLVLLGAEVTGFALPPPTTPSLFDQLGLSKRLRHIEGDVRDLAAVRATVEIVMPDFVFHLAAQPLVRQSYKQPVETYATNVMGTVNALEAIRLAGRPCAVVAITTDKCYENKEWVYSYREEDPMGGYDPYSSSKGAAELVIAAYRRSYFLSPDSSVKLASARAGNVIGGGDWAVDRIMPDCIRALRRGDTIPVRNKIATRPWQHVLEPLSGYLWLGACMVNPRLTPYAAHLTSAFNFGPSLASNRTVAELVQEVLKHWPGRWEDQSDPKAVHEARLLNLATDKAHHFLNWSPIWSFADTIGHTVAWYKKAEAVGTDIHALTTSQINAYSTAARVAGITWAT